MLKNKLVFMIIIFVGFGVLSGIKVHAGLGLSPASVERLNLKPGSTYTKTLYISQSNPENELKVFVEKDFERISDWISFSEGDEFTIPSDVSQYEFQMTINVPEDAELNQYEGFVRFKISPSDTNAAVSVITGARLEVKIAVTDLDEVNFLVRELKLPKVTDSGRLVLQAKIENLGNIEAAPTKAVLDIKTLTEQNMFVVESTNIPTIAAGETEIVEIIFDDVELEVGEYFANTSIFLQSRKLREEKLVLVVESPLGFMDEVTDVSASGLFSDNKDTITTVLSIVLILTILFTIIFFLFTRRKYNH